MTQKDIAFLIRETAKRYPEDGTLYSAAAMRDAFMRGFKVARETPANDK